MLIEQTLTNPQGQMEIHPFYSSFDDTADNQRPTGSGEYFAQVIIFMLPTHDALREITQAFVDFFQGVLGDEFLQGLARGADDTAEKEATLWSSSSSYYI